MTGKTIDVTPPDPAAMAWYELSDLGNARRLADLAMGKLKWVEDKWLAYDGRRWSAADGERLAQRLAHDVARHIPIEAEALAEQLEAMESAAAKKAESRFEERIVKLYQHAVQSGNTAKTAGMLHQAKSEIWARRDDFDQCPFTLNLANGTLRFVRDTGPGGGAARPNGRSQAPGAQRRNGAEDARAEARAETGNWTVELRPHDPTDMLTKIAEAEWVAGAPAPLWRAHMATVLPDSEVRGFFQRCCGYGLTGSIDEQAIFLLQGKGGDGKSTTMNALRDLLTDYGSNADVQTFIAGQQRSGAEASPDLARMAGDVRLVSTGEPRVGAALDEGRIKAVTGGSAITARELHGAPFEYVPRFKLFFECNRKPRISGDDDGIWRRVMVIQFPHQFKGDKIDKQVAHKFAAERSGILAWLVEGTLAWLEAGVLTPPVAVQEAIDDYRRAANPFGEWFGDRVDVRDQSARTPAKDLYDSYKAWCEENAVGDREIMSSTGFGRALSDKQIPKMKGSDGRVLRRGARLRRDSELFGAARAGGPASATSPPVQPGAWDDDEVPGD